MAFIELVDRPMEDFDYDEDVVVEDEAEAAQDSTDDIEDAEIVEEEAAKDKS